MKSLNAQQHKLSQPQNQVEYLSNGIFGDKLPFFKEKLSKHNLLPLKPKQVEVLQVNLGKICNQVCKHCHVDAGPDRKEIMTRQTMQQVLEALKKFTPVTIDLTGGAPEMNPDFRWLVKEIRKLHPQVKILVRCNLTIIVANKRFNDLPEFYREHRVEVVSSLPFYRKGRTDSQRGDGVFDRSIKALKMLNQVGYGKAGSGLLLDLVYNPTGAFLPPSQDMLQQQYKKELKQQYDVEFNNLYTITNLPVSRFLEYLVASGNYEEYMEKLVNSFNPAAAQNVMCRNTLSVGWDGKLYDCDFNQMLEVPLDATVPQHINEFSAEAIIDRQIFFHQHCYGCTAGAGSSCGGETAI